MNGAEHHREPVVEGVPKPERANSGLGGQPLRSFYTLLVAAGLFILLAVILVTGQRGDECRTITNEYGSEQVCFGQFPDEVRDFVR